MTINIDSNTEKLFFNYTLSKPLYIKYVHGYFFKNENIRYVYDCVRNEYMQSDNTKDFELNRKEVTSLVRFHDEEGNISSDFVKQLMKINLTDYNDDFIMKRYEPWVKSQLLLNGLMESYEIMQGTNTLDFKSVDKALGEIKKNIDGAVDVKLTRGNIGLDFDEIDDHDQNLEHNKILTGYDEIDKMLEGGFDRKTFNIFMGSPGSGKSLTMQNLAINFANNGYNVGYVTLELSDKKTLKRVGSMRLRIPINEYNERSKDKSYLKNKFNELKNRITGGIGEANLGKLYIKEYPSGTATVSDIDDWCQQVEDETGNPLDVLIIDYMQIMNTENGVDRNMLYLKGEHLSVGIRAIAQRRDLVSISATQTDKDKYGTNSYSLSDISESKSIADTADTVWGIVLTPIMKVNKKYQWQWLKLRDVSTDIERFEFDFVSEYMLLENAYPVIIS